MTRTVRTPRTPKKRAQISDRPAWPDRFLVALAEYGAILPAAEAIGVGRRTVYDELARNSEFKADVEAVKERCVQNVVSSLYQRALSPGGTTDGIFYLKNMFPEQFSDRLRQDQVEQIKATTRAEVFGDLEREIEQLPDGPRQIVMAALAAVAAKAPKELPPGA